MNIFNTSNFTELADVHKGHCVSIYVPTHRAGGPEGIKEDKILYKNQLQEITKKLSAYKLTNDQINKYLKPAYDLLEDERLWSHLSDGLMVFIYGDTIKYFLVPIEFNAQHHIEDSLYLLPAIPLLTDSGRHFILALSLNKVRFFEASRNSVTPVDVSDLVPEGMLDAVGADYEQESLQFRSGQAMRPEAAIYHGQGSGEMPEKKKEIEKYFAQVNTGIMKMLHDESAPLVLACVDYLYPIYEAKNDYKGLSDEFIPGNHDHTGPVMLQERAWDIIGDMFTKDREQAIETFEACLGNSEASFNVEEVIPASYSGRIETLFVRKGSELWGRYDPKTHEIDVEDVQRIGTAELINQAAIETIRHDGKVLYVSQEELPDEMEIVGATFRYSV